MHRFLPAAFVALLLAAAPAALAQPVEDAALGLAELPVYVEPGVEDVDADALRESAATAAAAGIDLRVAVLRAGDGEQLAVELRDRLAGATVVVFTETSYGVASDDVGQARLNAALDEAADELASPDEVAGVRALVAALTGEGDGGVSVGVVVVAVVAVLVAVGIGGRVWDARTRTQRQARKRDRRRGELRTRVGALGERVIELSDRIELTESAEARAAYARAAGIFEAAEHRIATADDMKTLDAIEADLASAAELLREADAAARAGGSPTAR